MTNSRTAGLLLAAVGSNSCRGPTPGIRHENHTLAPGEALTITAERTDGLICVVAGASGQGAKRHFEAPGRLSGSDIKKVGAKV